MELTEQTRECWNTSSGERSVRGSQQEARSLLCPRAQKQRIWRHWVPLKGEKEQGLVKCLYRVLTTLSTLWPLLYRGEQLLSFTPSRRWRRWLSIEVGTADCGDKLLYWKEGDWFWFGELLISGLLPLLDSADSDLDSADTLLGRKSEDSFLGNWPTQETRPTDADIWGSLGEKLSSLSFHPIWSSPVNNHPHPYTPHKHEFR